jgi:hypothetical protein
LTFCHIIQQKSQNLLSFLMDPLVGTQLAWPHGCAELVSHTHQRSVFFHQSVPKLGTPVCTQQRRQCPGPEETPAESPADFTVR